MHDLVIRGATMVDGLGHDPIRADIAVEDGRVAAIGMLGKEAAEVVDAGGLTPMPGIIDLHTHYDAQVTWDPTLSPSPSLGVTTAVMGNCGFGIVLSPPPLRDEIMRNPAPETVKGSQVDADGTSNSRLKRQKLTSFQWLAIPMWFPTGKDSVPADSGAFRSQFCGRESA